MAKKRSKKENASRTSGKRTSSTADPETRKRAARVYRRLLKRFPDPRPALEHESAYQLLVATILSAQCTDERVNRVTPALFAAYPDPASLAEADQEELETMIRSTGFYRNKAKSLKRMAAAVVENHGGEIPATMEELTALPGVARKTANVVLGAAFGRHEGIVVDTHVARVSRRLGFTAEKDPVKVERDLMSLFPRSQWDAIAHVLIFHGRETCKARKPACDECVVAAECPRIGVASDG